jgi:hypothetical protein
MLFVRLDTSLVNALMGEEVVEAVRVADMVEALAVEEAEVAEDGPVTHVDRKGTSLGNALRVVVEVEVMGHEEEVAMVEVMVGLMAAVGRVDTLETVMMRHLSTVPAKVAVMAQVVAMRIAAVDTLREDAAGAISNGSVVFHSKEGGSRHRF